MAASSALRQRPRRLTTNHKRYLNQAIHEINKGEKIDADQNLELARLRKENRELQLYVLSLAKLLMRKQVITETELASIVNLIDPAE